MRCRVKPPQRGNLCLSSEISSTHVDWLLVVLPVNESGFNPQLFAELFDPVIKDRHNGYDPKTMIHPTDLDSSKVKHTLLDLCILKTDTLGFQWSSAYAHDSSKNLKQNLYLYRTHIDLLLFRLFTNLIYKSGSLKIVL